MKSQRRRLLRFGLVLALALFTAPRAIAQDKSEWFYLSNDGDPTLMVETPSYYSVPDTSQHIGIVPYKTEVEVLETRQDAALGILQWKKIRVLSGAYRGKTGWVSGNCVVRSTDPRPTKPGPADDASRLSKRNSPVPDGAPKITGIVATATQLRDQPNALDSAVDAPRVSADTLVARISRDEHSEDVGLKVTWIQVRVLDGPHKDKEGWILRHHVREYRRLLYFAIWYKVSDRAYERAATTALDELEATLKTDTGTSSADPAETDYVRMSIGVRTKSQFLAAWKQVKDRAEAENLEVYYGALVTHASIQDNARDGLEFGPEEADSTLRPNEISRLDRLPWSDNAKGLYLHGCYSGAFEGWIADRRWCPAQILAKKQRIRTWGEVGISYFSTDRDTYVESKSSDTTVYLHTFNRGKNKPFGDGSRVPPKEFRP